MASDELSNLLKAGIQAAKDKNKTEARRLLEQVLEHDDANELAWLWLATVMDTPREQRICLENVLEINPNNERAKQMLERLRPSPITDGSSGSSSAVSKPVRQSVNAPASKTAPRPLTNKPLPNERYQAARQQNRAVAARRRLSPVVLVGGIILGLVMILGGGFVLYQQITTSTQTPTPDVTVAVANLGKTVFPANTPTVDASFVFPTHDPSKPALPPTWTSVPTNTPLPTLTPSATLPPVASYNFLYVGEGRGRKDLAIYSTTGGAKTEQMVVGGDASDVAYSPDGKLIAYVTGTNSGSAQIAVANADGSNAKTITTLTGKHAGKPNWMPDGSRIVFYADQTGNNELYTITPAGQGQTQITQTKVNNIDPVYSPEGTKILYASDVTGHNSLQIVLLDLKTGATTQLTQAQNDNLSPAFAPDGNHFVFVSTRDGQHDVYMMGLDGSGETLLTFNDNQAENRDATWSPDGRYILFASNRNGGVMNLFLITPDAKTIRQVTNFSANTYGGRMRPINP